MTVRDGCVCIGHLLRVFVYLFPLISMIICSPLSAQPEDQRQGCPGSGFVDSPQTIDSPIEQVVSGWVLTDLAIERIEILNGSELIAQGRANLDRPDVLAAFAGCTPAGPPGFAIPVSGRNFSPLSASLRVEAVTAAAQRILLGSIGTRLDGLFGVVDSREPVSWQGSRTVSGWAATRNGPVTIRVTAQGQEVATGTAIIERIDVQRAYENWILSPRVGFAVPIPFERLPRGRYTLKLHLTDAQGNSRTWDGPEVINDQSFGFVGTVNPIRLDGENVVRGWAVSAQGSSRVKIKARDLTVAEFAANKKRDDVGNLFRLWPNAMESGFDALISLSSLPRGRYPLVIEFSDDTGVYQVATGPLVENDFPIGRVLSDEWQLLNPGDVDLEVWVADEDGIGSVELVDESGALLGILEQTAQDVPYPPRDYQSLADFGKPAPVVASGSIYHIHWFDRNTTPGVNRLSVRVTDNLGTVAILPGPLVVRRDVRASATCSGRPFTIYLPGETFVLRRGLGELHSLRALVDDTCIEVGLRARVEYLRMTKGKSEGYAFDPDFPDSLRVQPQGQITSTALSELLAYRRQWNIPLLVTLDGGPWGDARFAAPSIDIVDVLERDEINVQWNQHSRSEPDDALAGLAGSYGSPQLARMMSLNVYNEAFRSYKRRNLKAAVKALLSDTSASKPNQLAINLDPDQYINPWFYLTQWYDYNPNTLRQYREWLTGTGIYANGAPLSNFARTPLLDLAAINALAGQNWTKLKEVDPPRSRPDYTSQWHQLWTEFKRHLVAMHYNDLARWVAEADFAQANIFTSQTFIQTDVSVTGSDEASGWPDEAGVSLAGAKPKNGHLGAILYGPASRNEGEARSGSSLFQNIRDIDPDWGVVELHPATIEFAERVPDHSAAYRTVAEILNHGARFISPMWGNHMADRFVYPERFRSYDSFAGSDFEYQLVWWMRYRASMPSGSLSYPFGNHVVMSADGWTADAQAKSVPGSGFITLSSAAEQLTFTSPDFGQLHSIKPALLTVSGTWPASTRGELKVLNDGEVLHGVQPATSQPGTAGISFSVPPSTFDQISIIWRNTTGGSPGPITIDDISLSPQAGTDDLSGDIETVAVSH